MDLHEIPGYDEALAEEREMRARVCIGVPHDVCGVALRPMTLQDFVNLQALRSPFVSGGFIRRMDCMQLVCYMRADYVAPSNNWLGRWLGKRRNSAVLRRLRTMSTSEIIGQINNYMDTMFLDSPASSSGGVESAPIASSTASIIDQLGSSYGWSIGEMMAVELPLIFQLFRIRHIMDGGKRSALINRKSSKVIGDYLRKLNSTE